MLGTNWTRIHALEALLKVGRGKEAYRRNKVRIYTAKRHVAQAAGNTAHYWYEKHIKEHNVKAAQVNSEQIKRYHREIAKLTPLVNKWRSLLTQQEKHNHGLADQINKLKPKGHMWPMGGWVKYDDPAVMQRQDQGQDFEIPRYHSVVAPGHGRCVQWAADGAFPNGFGNPYAVVYISDGPFAGREWYIGHCNEVIIRPGESFVPGQPLARANHSLDAGWGWVELGHWPPGSMNEGVRFHYLFKPVWR